MWGYDEGVGCNVFGIHCIVCTCVMYCLLMYELYYMYNYVAAFFQDKSPNLEQAKAL